MNYYLGPWVLVGTRMVSGVPRPRWGRPPGTVGMLDFRSLPGHEEAGVGLFCTPDEVTLDSDYYLIGQGHITEVVPQESQRAVFASMLGMDSVSGDTLMDWAWDALTLRSDAEGELRVKPLMPTMQRELEVYLGGHSLVRSRPFELSSPEGAKVIEVLHIDYRRVYEDTRDGKLGTVVGGRFEADLQFHRRWLKTLEEKYRVTNGEDVFIPHGLPKDKSLPHKTSHSESWLGGDTTTLGGDLTWAEVAGNWNRVSNKARQMSSGFAIDAARAEADVSSSDHECQATVAVLTNSTFAGPAARFSAGAVTCYTTGPYSGDGHQYLSSVVAGIETNLDDVAITPSLPEVYTVRADGSVIKGYQVSAERISLTDTSITDGTRGGLFATSDIGSSVDIGSWYMTDLAAQAQAPRSMHQFRQRAAA